MHNVLINIITNKNKKSTTHHLTFNYEKDGCWYIDLPNWPFAHHNLKMVAGSDDLCAFYAEGKDTVSVCVIPSKEQLSDMQDFAELSRIDKRPIGGATYNVNNLQGFDEQIWICPVTLFVLHEYPKYIYIKKE